MLRLILGRTYTGKTTYVRKILAEKAARGLDAVLIVPEQFSFETDKEIIEMMGAKKASEIMTLSFTSLAKKILDEYSPGRKPPVTDAAKTVLMSLTLEALSEQLEIFKGCAKNRRSVAEILHITDELIQCDVSYDSMREAARSSGNAVLIQKSHEVELIATLYSALLNEKFSDERYMINAASEIIAEKKLFEGKTVILDEFTGFTAQQNLMLAEFLKQADDVYITMCAESVKDHSEGTGAFSHSSENINKLISLAKRNGVAVAEPVVLEKDGRYNSEAISFIEKGVYEPCPEIFDGEAKEVTVAAARNLYEECEFAAMNAKRLVREQGLRYRDIVIVSRSDEYLRYMPFALKKYGIPVFEDTRRKLNEEIIVIYALCGLTLAAEGFTTDLMLRWMKTYISPVSEDEISLLENYVFMWQTDYNGWLREWTGNPDGLGVESDEKTEEKLAMLNTLRKKAVTPILSLREKLADADGFTATQALYEFLTETKADENLLEFAKKLDNETAYECERSWDEFMTVLSLLAETVGDRSISPKRYLELFKIMTESSDIGDIPGGIDEITVGDADRIRVSAKKAMMIVGANEGVFPSSGISSFVFTDNEKRTFKNNGVELGTDNMESMRKERLRVYSILSVPSDWLFVSYSLGSIKGEEKLPSEIVHTVRKIVPGCRNVDIVALEPLEKIESRMSAFESAAERFYENSVYSESVKKYVGDTNEFSDMFRGIERAANKNEIKFEDPKKASLLFGKNMYISPSKVEEYYKCPFKYFCRYGIKAMPLDRVSYDARQNGLLIHFVLENLVSKYGGEALFAMSEQERRQAVSQTTDEYIEKYVGAKDGIDKRLLFSLERSKDTICQILERIAPQFRDCKFIIRDVELRIGNDCDVKPYQIEVPGGKVMLHGVVDRIDTMTDDEGKTYLRVLDYKSGGKDFKLTDVVSGLNIQMLVYLMCLYENGRERYGDFVPAGILYISAKAGKNSLDRYADEEVIAKEKTKQSKMKGIVLGEEDVIVAMEGGGDGSVIGAKFNKKGEITGSVYNLEEFRLLHNAIDKIIADMATSLHDGKVDALPIYGGNYKSTCDYCDYKFVCCHEEGDRCRELFEGDAWSELEAMNDE